MIKRILFVLSPMLAALLSACCGVDDISDFKDVTGLNDSAPIFVENFEDGAKRWDLPDGFAVKLREGINGTGTLVYDRQTPEHYEFATVDLGKLDPRKQYRLTVSFRSELREDPARNTMEVFDIRSYKGNGEEKKMIARVFRPKTMMNAPDWQEIGTVFSVPAEADSTVLSLMITPKRTGKLWYDNIRIEPAGNAGEQFHLTKPAMLRLNDRKEVEFRFVFAAPPADRELALIVEADGRKFQFPVKSNTVGGCLPGVDAPVVKLEAVLVDLKSREILNRKTFTVFNPPPEKPAGAVSFDNGGKMEVDGKPFLPIGIFLGDTPYSHETFQRIKDAGFNTVLALGTHPFAFYGGAKATRRESMSAALDVLQKYGFKLIFAIKYQLPGQHPIREMDQVKGLENVNRYIVESVKDHPAFLAWYVSDENPVDQVPEISKLRRQISAVDPWHPTLTLTDKPRDMFSFAATGDALLIDPYPIGRVVGKEDQPQDMESVRKGLDAAATGGTPVWLVPQIFAWSSFQTHRQKHRYPTETEIRSMTLQGTVRGVRGYVFYAYHAIFRYSEKADPGKTGMQWANVVPTIRLLNELSPFILSEEKAPEVTLEQISGPAVEARAFRSKGKVMLVITAVGPGEANAKITVAGAPELKSRYGRTIRQKEGVYLFTGKDVDSDVLFGE